MKTYYAFTLFCTLSIFAKSQDTLHIACSGQPAASILNAIQSHPQTRCVIFEGLDSRFRWKKIIPEVAKLNVLEEVCFGSNAFETLPVGLESLTQIKRFTLTGSENLRMESALPLFQKLNRLEKITWELYALDEMPFDLISLQSLDSLIIIDAELADYRKFYPEVLNDKDVVHRYSELPLTGQDLRTVTIKVEFITAQEEASPYVQDQVEPESAEESEVPLSSLARKIDCPTNAYCRKYESVNPPIKGVEVTKEFYAVQATTPTVIASNISGTKIIIPPDAFVDAFGNEIIGEVVVDYREYRDAADFIISGIPMTFPQSDSSVSFFRSAGMFEINASQNGNEIFLREGEEIKINFASVDSKDEYQFYALRDSSNEWQDMGVAQKGSAPYTLNPDSYSEAADYYAQFKGMNGVEILFDSTLFSDRYSSFDYSGVMRKVNNSYRFTPYNSNEMYSSLHIEKVRRNRGGGIVFELKNNRKGNPELKKLQVKHWQLKSDMTHKQFRKIFHRKKYFNDIRVIQNGENFTLQFKDAHEFIEIEAQSVKKIKTKHKTIYKSQTVRFESYQKALAQRQKKFDQRLYRDIKRYRTLFTRQDGLAHSRRMKYVRQLMTADERNMSQAEWDNYCDSLSKSAESAIASPENFTRALGISGFGIYNCDQIIRLENPETIFANYRDQNNERVSGKCVYVVDRKINGVLSYSGGAFLNVHHFTLDPDNVTAIVILGKDDRMYDVALDDLVDQNIREDHRCEFKVHSDDKPVSIGELKKRIGM